MEAPQQQPRSKSPSKDLKLPPAWKHVSHQYRPIKVIGCGSFGEIVKAKSLETGRNVAIKRMHCLVDNEIIYTKLIREIDILAQLSKMKENQFTTKLLDIIASPSFEGPDSYLFLVMDYVQADLLKLLDKSNELKYTEDNVILILYRLLCCLQFLHSAGLMHRDLKPANILVDSELNVRLCDFGLSRSVLKKKDPSELSSSASRASIAERLTVSREERKSRKRNLSRHVTTRWYRAPEVILLEKEYDERTDLWSVGCILQELIFCQQDYKEFNSKKSKRILFKSDSCFPLSPSKHEEHNDELGISKNDLLKRILLIMGDPDEQAMSFITEPTNRDYLGKLSQGMSPINLAHEFKASSGALVAILTNLLEFNPYFRESAADLLKNEIFNRVREPSLEVKAPFKISIDLDETNDYDYYKKKYRRTSLASLKASLSQKIAAFRQ